MIAVSTLYMVFQPRNYKVHTVRDGGASKGKKKGLTLRFILEVSVPDIF